MTDKRPTIRLAVLIDADNAQASRIKAVLKKISTYGHITISRAYADWTQENMTSWQEPMRQFGIRPIQQMSYVNGKNVTDFALVIDAMDILHSGKVQGICIVSSDSDFTPLCQRIREQNLFVMGIGESKTPQPLVQACHIFVYVETLDSTTELTLSEFATQPYENVVKDTDLKLMVTAYKKASKDSGGWANLGEIGSVLYKLDKNFGKRLEKRFKSTSLSNAVRHFPSYFQLKKVETINYVRLKK